MSRGLNVRAEILAEAFFSGASNPADLSLDERAELQPKPDACSVHAPVVLSTHYKETSGR